MAAAKPTRPKSSPMKYRAMTITIIGRRATSTARSCSYFKSKQVQPLHINFLSGRLGGAGTGSGNGRRESYHAFKGVLRTPPGHLTRQ